MTQIRSLLTQRRILIGALVVLAAAVVVIVIALGLTGDKGVATASAATGSAATAAADASASDGALNLDDMALGAADAPITIIEYASMTCPHCKTFHETVWPSLKRDWVDTGKARLIFREFPLDGAALRAAMLARCGGPGRFFAFIDLLFAQQARWSRAPETELRRLAALGGLDGAAHDACIADSGLENRILSSRLQANKQYGVNATPSLIINGQKYEGRSNDYGALNSFLKSRN